MPLRLRLTLFYTLFLAIVLAAVASAVYAYTERSLIRDLSERAEQTLMRLREGGYRDPKNFEALADDVNFRLTPLASTPLSWSDLKGEDQITMIPSPRQYSTISPTGERIVSSGLLQISRNNLLEAFSETDYKVLFDTDQVSTRLRVDGRQFIVYARIDEFVRPPFSFPAIAMTALPYPSDTLTGLRALLLRTTAIAFVVFAAGVWVLSYQVLLPVKRVTQAASRVSGRDLSQRVPVPRAKDEMKELAVTLNNMLERLQGSFDTQRRFTADASHELRTPVTAIVGHVNYLLRRTKPTEEQVDSLTVIRSEGERMAKLVNDLLELARADAGLSITREPMNIVEVIEEVHMEIAPVARDAKIGVSVSDPLIEVDGDAARLKQVVLNLVQNALNAGSNNITITAQGEKKEVRLEVLDDGPGIPAEAIPKLFDRFFRVDGARSTRGNGSGLGLSIVRWIVQQHEGTVTVESKVGEGTVFTVLLPALDPKQTDAGFIAQTFAGVRPQAKAKTAQASR